MRGYEVKRVLVSRHLPAILNLPVLDKETTAGLMKLADDNQQHVASLSALGVSVGSAMIVHLLESKLPKSAIDRWDTMIGRDELPSTDQMYEFIYKAAICASKRERASTTKTDRNSKEPPGKRRRFSASNRALMLNVSRNWVACKVKRHPLYVCEKFKQLSIPQRVDLVKKSKLCYNCMRSYKDTPCKWFNCTVCHKRHNTMLHLENYGKDKSSNSTAADNKVETNAVA